MTQTEGFKKRKYKLSMQDSYNDFLRTCAKPRTITELSIIFNIPKDNIKNWVRTLAANGHVKADYVKRNLDMSTVVAVSKYVPESDFEAAYIFKPRSIAKEEEIKHKWAGNPFREYIA
jgi:hypothetical protein